MTEPRIFTLEEVNTLVPKLQSLVGRQLSRRADIEAKLKDLGEVLGQVPEDLSVGDNDDDDVRTLKKELTARVEEYRCGWRDVEELGGVLKDTRKGLVDFYGHVDGKLVWLCWCFGESEVSHYHGLDEGYGARKQLNAGLRKHLLN